MVPDRPAHALAGDAGRAANGRRSIRPGGTGFRHLQADADGSIDEIRDHQAPWGIHRHRGFIDPSGHPWLVGDKSL
jgi:hypothetical protein